MRPLRRYIDKIKPNFSKDGKFEKLESTFNAFETFLFVPDKVTTEGSHIRDALDMKRAMALVVLALIPALLFGMWNTGYQHFLATGTDTSFWKILWFGFLKVFPIVVVSYVTGLGLEFTIAQIRGHEVNEGFLVTGMLIPLILPADIPLWMVVVSTAFAVILGKEIFGGTGMNIWNPALVARAFLFFAYPSEMSGDNVWIAGMKSGEGIIDGFSGATILGQAATGKVSFINGFGETITPWDMFFGTIPGSIGETSTIAILIGAFILIYTGIGSWKIMLSVFAGGAFMSGLLNIFAVNEIMKIPFWEHWIIGGFAFGAVFMATDPVTASQTETGKWIYGVLIGILAILIRVLNPAYPEGMMLSILLMNTFAPLIDYYIYEVNINRRMKRAKLQLNRVSGKN